MSKYSVVFDYSLGDAVRIIPLDLEGMVDGLCLGAGNVKTYAAVYWTDGQRRREWLTAREIETFPYTTGLTMPSNLSEYRGERRPTP